MAPAPYDMQSSYWECFKSDISRLWQEKKLQIKKTQKKAEKHFLFQKKSDAYVRHYYNYFTFEIYDFLEEKFWGNFRSLTISRIHLLTLFAYSPHFFWRRAWKSERNLNLLWTESESKCVFTFYQCSTFDAFLADSHETRKIVTAWDVLSKDICSRVWPTLDRLMFLK